MLVYQKHAGVPSDPVREFAAFCGSISQRVLHNNLVTRLETARQNLESKTGDELYRQQGIVSGLRAALELLHAFDSRDVKKDFGIE